MYSGHCFCKDTQGLHVFPVLLSTWFLWRLCGLRKKNISLWFEWTDHLKKMQPMNTVINKILWPPRYKVMFFLRIRCKNIRKRQHNSHLLMKAAQWSAVIISCQMGFLCVWFNGFDYYGRIWWIDYIPAGKKIDGTAYSSQQVPTLNINSVII